MTYRNRKLLDLAHSVCECQLQLPGVCEGYSAHGCEPAHSNQQIHGKGMGNKAADCFHVPACHSCHAEFDQGKRFTKEEKREYFRAGLDRTVLLYWERDLIKVAA